VKCEVPAFRRAADDQQDERMAVPKKKKSKAKTRSRRASAWTLKTPARSNCPRCGEVKQPHRVCGSCGWYRGRQAVDVA
jgi:large subunit ribosomal protein L32